MAYDEGAENRGSRLDFHAVARGDVIGSTELSAEDRRQLPEVLRSTYATVQRRAPGTLPYELAILGGDGWQCYVENPASSLARVLHLWALLFARGISSRMALAIDTIDFISDRDLNESDGRAFRRSGRALQGLEDERWFVCLLPDEAPSAYHLAAESISELTDHLLHQWTEAQAQAVAGMLESIGTEQTVTQQAIAEQWEPEPITRQTVNRHLKRAHWDRLERTLDRFDQLIESLSSSISSPDE